MDRRVLVLLAAMPVDVAAQCLPAPPPVIAAPAIAPNTRAYAVSWGGNLTLTPNFELQEATNENFSDAVTIAVSGALTRTMAARGEAAEERRVYYRVRGIAACSGQAGQYSRTASTVLTPALSEDATEFSIGIPAGSAQLFTQDYLVPGFGATATNDDRFTLVLDAPWLTVFPPAGALSAGGTTVQFTIDPAKMTAGTSRAMVSVQRTQPSGSATTALPISVSLAPAITPLPREVSPPAAALIIPGVAHADGSNSRFQSDVRLLNSGSENVTYELAYTPTASDGTLTGKKIRVDVGPDETKSFDDIVKMFFGSGLLGEIGIGTLEIRPVGAAPAAATTFASSRTYNVSSAGTFGQYIPALPRSAFIGSLAADPLARISLQQIAASASFRTNVGFVEGSGQQAEARVKLLDPAGRLLGQVPLSLRPFEHRQFNLNDPALFPGVTIDDARIEVEVTSATGLVSAYASVLDNQTSDPLLVSPIQPARRVTSRTVLPGIAELTGARNFHSDMRIYHAGSSPVTVTLSYRPQGGATPPPAVTAVLDAGEVLATNDVLPSLWGLTGTGGAVTLTTSSPVPLVVSARTFSRNATGGTFGQFIEGVRPADAAFAGARALEVLQLEESPNFRSNLGLFEVTGEPATVEIIGYSADRTASMLIDLSGGEFRQLNSLFVQLGLAPVYSGRVRVLVLSGNGRVSSYASVIDSRTEDPTFIPAQ
jgi:hypothetical protein